MNRPIDIPLLLEKRISTESRELRQAVANASQVVIFGSTSAGLQTSKSDLDVFCVGDTAFKFKSAWLDLTVSTRAEVESADWLGSELANHIGCYGIWLRGNPDWRDGIRIGDHAIDRKRRRIKAFMRHLPLAWDDLESGYRAKYGIKLRRETQRLILLESGVPVPPTVLLDNLWISHRDRCDDVLLKLQSVCPAGFDVEKLINAASLATMSAKPGIERNVNHPQLQRAAQVLLGFEQRGSFVPLKTRPIVGQFISDPVDLIISVP